VKNKAPAEVQITAEQLLREAKERELELLPPPPKQKITDEEELNDYKLKKRKVSGGQGSHLSYGSHMISLISICVSRCAERTKSLAFPFGRGHLCLFPTPVFTFTSWCSFNTPCHPGYAPFLKGPS